MNKRRLTAGETIVETLMAILIITFTMLFLANAVVSSARVNAAVDNSDNAFERESDPSKGTVANATFSMEGVDPMDMPSVEVNVYKTEGEDGAGGEYYYYERVTE